MNTKTEQKEWWLYGLVNPRTGSIRYCGQSCRLTDRKSKHKKRYPWLKLQKIGRCESLAEVLIWEWLMVELLEPPLNVVAGGGVNPMIGRKHTKKTRVKISAVMKGKTPWNKGKTGVYSVETREKMSSPRLGKNNPFYGKKHTKETRKKLSNMLSGENHPNYGNRGRKHTAEAKKKISKARIKSGHWRGKNHTKETKKKMAASRREWWKRQREMAMV